jgi:beta-galactosidase
MQGKGRLRKLFVMILIAVLTIPMIAVDGGISRAYAASSEEVYTPPIGRSVYNFNMDWKFYKGNAAGAELPAFDDSSWETVSVPHTFNDVDSYDEWITHDGEASVWRGIVWYRKHFKLDASQSGKKVFIEFEGIRQSAHLYVNGQFAGRYEAGVTPFGFDISSYIHFGDADNVIAVKNDNSGISETGTGTSYQWNGRGFNPVYGGLTRNVNLYVMENTYFTLPLYSNLGTYGTYIYPSHISTDNRTARINFESQIKNDSSQARAVSLEAVIVDMDGKPVKTIMTEEAAVSAGADYTFKASGDMTDVKFWQPGYPYLYEVFFILKEGTAVLDVYPITTGFRKADFKGGWDEGGVYINNKQVYLSGYAQRSTNEWALLGAATPQWIADYDGQLIVDSHANLIRWMHISATPASIRMTDKYGIVSVQPAGDSEKDVEGRQWEQRMEVMRDSMIYFRNNPSILFWESGNNAISPQHMRQMNELKQQLDPHGMRAVGSRGLSAKTAVDEAEYIGTMLNRHYTDYARDKGPIIETEYTRDEAPRRVWDDYSPPDFGYKYDPSSTWTYNSEEFAIISSAVNFYEYYKDRIQGPETSNEMYSGQAALVWADSNQHGRNYLTETARLSGRVDALRIPKESFYAFQVMQNDQPGAHLVGHWNYPAGTKKDMYVIANHVESVELFVNGVSKGKVTDPKTVVDKKRNVTHQTPYVFTFPNITWEAGTIKAVGYDASGNVLVETLKETAGAPAAIKLTPMAGPDGWRADGTDPVIIDVEVVDAEGRRVPTDQARIDFEYSGPGRFLGGYNSGKQYSTFKDYIDTEAGINRVIVRSTREAGAFTLTAKRDGLQSAQITLVSKPFEVHNGLTTERQAELAPSLPSAPPVYGPDVWPTREIKPRVISSGKPASASGEEADRGNVARNANDGSPSTRWTANNGSAGHWWKVDLQGMFDLKGSEVLWYRSDAYYRYKIEVSADDQNWTLVVDRTDNSDRMQTMKDEFEATARFVRITVTGTEAGWASMYEFKVFGSGSTSAGEWSPPSLNANYDFGTTDSPVETGFVRVSDETKYTSMWQFGFDDITKVQSYDRDVVASDLNRDYIIGNSALFRVELPNQTYDVTITAGDELESNQTELSIQGEQQLPITSQAGQYVEQTYKTRVTNGLLHIQFSGRINAIQIMPLPPSPIGLSLLAKNDQKVTIGWNPVNGSMGYKVYRAEDDSTDFKLIGDTQVPMYEDMIENEGASSFTYRVTAIMEMGEVTLVGESFPSDPLHIDLAMPAPNWKDEFFFASDYFSEVDPTSHKPIIQLVPDIPSGVKHEQLIWSSSAPEIASVDTFGVVTAHEAGGTEITARTADGRFKATTKVYVPVISESFDNQRIGDTWGARTGTAGGSGNLSGTIADISGNKVFRLNGGGTGVRSTQKAFATPVVHNKLMLDFDWNIGAPSGTPGAQLSVEDSTGQRYLTLQYTAGQEMIYGTGGTASNAVITGTRIGTGLHVNHALYRVRVTLDFEDRTMDLVIENKDNPDVKQEVTGIPFDAGTSYKDDTGKIQFNLVRQSGATTSWTSWIDNFNIYALPELASVPDPEPEILSASLIGPDSLAAGQTIDLNVGVTGATYGFRALDMTIHYDPSKLEFDMVIGENGSRALAEHAIAPSREGLHVLGTSMKPDEGSIRIILVGLSEIHDGSLLVVRGRTKSNAADGVTIVKVSDFLVSRDGDERTADLSEAEHSLTIKTVIIPVDSDKTLLIQAIGSAQRKHDDTVEGSKIGQYRIGAKAALQSAINTAEAVRDNIAADQSVVDTATAALNEAVERYLQQFITLAEGSTHVSIGDLAIAAKHYGTTSTDPEWIEIEPADLFDEGEITIRALAAIARMILADWMPE